jgi:hypothetical protein
MREVALTYRRVGRLSYSGGGWTQPRWVAIGFPCRLRPGRRLARRNGEDPVGGAADHLCERAVEARRDGASEQRHEPAEPGNAARSHGAQEGKMAGMA